MFWFTCNHFKTTGAHVFFAAQCNDPVALPLVLPFLPLPLSYRCRDWRKELGSRVRSIENKFCIKIDRSIAVIMFWLGFIQIWRGFARKVLIEKSCWTCLLNGTKKQRGITLKGAPIMLRSRTCSHLWQVWVWVEPCNNMQLPVHGRPRSEVFWLHWAREHREKELLLPGRWTRTPCERNLLK